MITLFFAGSLAEPGKSIVSAVMLLGIVLFGIGMTLLISWLLSHTLLKGVPSSFTLELPPYRRPQIGKIILRSICDRTVFVLGRAVTVAIPAGALIWALANITIGDRSVLIHCTTFLQPLGELMGMDGVILMAFLLGFPANEIVVPIILMSYLSTGYMVEYTSLAQLGSLLTAHGWTWLTALCVMIFSLLHFPCATTCWTIGKETQSAKWTALSFVLPTLLGMILCILIAATARLMGLA